MPRTYKPTGRPRGRPKGSKNKPKTVEEFLAAAASGTLIPEVVVKPPRKNRKPGDPYKRRKSAKCGRKAARTKTAASYANVGRKKGVPYHSHQAKHEAIKAALKPEITRIVKIMKKNGDLPEDVGVAKCVSALLEIVGADFKASDRISAAKTFLDFHKVKPTSKKEVTIKSAEDFLTEMLDGDDGD